jgi:hypothetical protein
MAEKRRTLSQLAEEHQRLSDEWDRLEEKQKKIEQDMAAVAALAREAMERDGTVEGSTGTVEFELREREHYNVKDFDKLWQWCLETRRFVFQKRVAVEAYRDYTSSGIRVPGVAVFKETTFRTKRKKARPR